MLLKQSATDWVIDEEEKLMSRNSGVRDVKIKVLASDEELLAVSSCSGSTRRQESPFRMALTH